MNTPQGGCLERETDHPRRGLRGEFAAVVAGNHRLCRDHYRLVLRLPAFPPTGPGQFIQIACAPMPPPLEDVVLDDWRPGDGLAVAGPELKDRIAVLRRPFSLAGRRDVGDGVELEIVHRVIGVGTAWLSGRQVGDPLGVLGPLGNRFDLPTEDQVAILVAGGVGIPPMLYLASALAGRRAVAFAGAQSRDLLPLTVLADTPAPSPDRIEPLYNIAEFARHGIPAVISTDDGSCGFRGLVTQALERYLDEWGSDQGTKRWSDEGGRGNDEVRSPKSERMTNVEARMPTGNWQLATGNSPPIENRKSKIENADHSALSTQHSPLIYACGPEAMMKRVVEIAAARGLECQVAVERAMACGMGTCQSCVIRVRKSDPSRPPLAGQQWCYRLACTDGPVFRGADVLW